MAFAVTANDPIIPQEDLRQGSLFADDQPPWEWDDSAEQTVATVVFSAIADREFDYAVPDQLAATLRAGQRVLAPLGRGDRSREGYCVRVETRQINRPLKSLAKIIDRQSLISPAMLRLTRWMADHYLAGWAQVLEAVLPAGVRAAAGTRKRLVITAAEDARQRAGELRLTPKQTTVMDYLLEAGRGVPLSRVLKDVGCSQAPINALRRKGLLQAKATRMPIEPPRHAATARREDWELNDDQQAALRAILDALTAGNHETLLLHGVTGSGKTEVYIQAIQEVVRYGRQAIVLVPEISLTPQTRQRFRERFDDVAVLHSHLTDVERHHHWQRIAAGEVQVVVGARSAVFAPTPNLGLIVLDEEHESSFKQEIVPRYHARSVALRRARDEAIPVVLGSATPSLESWQKAVEGQYRLIELPRRVYNRPMPAVRTIDLRHEGGQGGFRGAISRPLRMAMEEALADGGQVILLLNRRGFSTHIQCPSCGEVVRCPDCDIALTHHRQKNYALCHYCDYQMPAPDRCPHCGVRGIRYGGLGTEKLEAEVRSRFPDHRCLRMDTDAMRRPGSHEAALSAFRQGKVRILLGTQMIAKGLDFPNVTLVGVINADLALHLPDFRAGERTFQLIAQVAGRTGRGHQGGRVLVQTFNPDHPSIRAAATHDYQRFAEQALAARQRLDYPPFSEMIRLVIRAANAELASSAASGLHDALVEQLGRSRTKARLLGPAPAPISRLRGKYRMQIQLQGPDGDALRAAVTAVASTIKLPEAVQWIADVDPLSML